MKSFTVLTLAACVFCARLLAGEPANLLPSPPDPAKDRQAFMAWQTQLRQQLSDMLGIPHQRVPLASESRGEVEHDGVVIEKWVFTSEPGSRVPAVLYRPKSAPSPMPAIVFTYGHGGSKGSWSYNYAGLLYAKLGVATLAMDPIGEAERNIKGATGTRAHDVKGISERCDAAGRLIMGKFVFDTMRCVDFLMARRDIAHDRIGVAGNSLGGATGGWMAALETRLRMAVVTGWAYDDATIPTKLCTRWPNERMRKLSTWAGYAALSAPHCALFIGNGDADVIIDQAGTGVACGGTRAVVAEAAKTYAAIGAPGGIEAWLEPGGGHRPYFAYAVALEWIHKHLGTPGWTLERIRALPTLNAGEWCDRHGIKLEKLYGTTLHWRGAILPDLGLRPTPREKLACLRPEEIGRPEFTLEGWLDHISKRP